MLIEETMISLEKPSPGLASLDVLHRPPFSALDWKQGTPLAQTRLEGNVGLTVPRYQWKRFYITAVRNLRLMNYDELEFWVAGKDIIWFANRE